MIFPFLVPIHPTEKSVHIRIVYEEGATYVFCLAVCVEPLVLFLRLLSLLINGFRFRRLMCVSFDWQDFYGMIFFLPYRLVLHDINTRRRLEIDSTLRA